MPGMRSFLIAFVVALLVGCSSSEPPQSAYYIVSFEPSGATLLPEGHAALERAIREAGQGKPSSVIVKAYVAADDSGRELSEQRVHVVEQALVDGGVPKRLVRVVLAKTDAADLARLGDGFVVQVERGNAGPRNPVGSE
jgi:ribosomal protein S12 methylthiotransferase accessory factor YcaO